MKLIFDIIKIVKDGKKAVKIKVKAKDLSDWGSLTKILRNKVFYKEFDSAGVKQGYKVVDDLFKGGDTNKAVFIVNDDKSIKEILDRIVSLYKDALKEIVKMKNWEGRKKLEYNC